MIDLDYIMHSIYFYYWLRNLNVRLIGSLKLNSLYIVLVRDLVRAYRLLTELNHQLCEYTSHCFPSSMYVICGRLTAEVYRVRGGGSDSVVSSSPSVVAGGEYSMLDTSRVQSSSVS